METCRPPPGPLVEPVHLVTYFAERTETMRQGRLPEHRELPAASPLGGPGGGGPRSSTPSPTPRTHARSPASGRRTSRVRPRADRSRGGARASDPRRPRRGPARSACRSPGGVVATNAATERPVGCAPPAADSRSQIALARCPSAMVRCRLARGHPAREHRGDGHSAALVGEGIGGTQADELHALAEGIPAVEKFENRVRPGRPSARLDPRLWRLALRGLDRARGWLSGAGRETTDRIESRDEDDLTGPRRSRPGVHPEGVGGFLHCHGRHSCFAAQNRAHFSVDRNRRGATMPAGSR